MDKKVQKIHCHVGNYTKEQAQAMLEPLRVLIEDAFGLKMHVVFSGDDKKNGKRKTRKNKNNKKQAKKA